MHKEANVAFSNHLWSLKIRIFALLSGGLRRVTQKVDKEGLSKKHSLIVLTNVRRTAAVELLDKPLDVLHGGEAVCNDPHTLVLPEGKDGLDIGDNGGWGDEHTLPDTTHVTKVEHVVELGWSRQHLHLGVLQADDD